MSLIHVLLIKDRKICFKTIHFRELQQLLSSASPKTPVDSGYLIIDFDENKIISNQNAIDINNINLKKSKSLNSKIYYTNVV